MSETNEHKSRPAKDRSRVHYRRFHNIFLYVTERCQLRCRHCYMGDRLERGLTMPFEMAVSIIGRCHRLGGEYITFIGGEPTLHPDLHMMVDYALEVGYTQVMVNTNGLSDRFIGRIAPEKLHYLSFSLDGAAPETHDYVRGRGTFGKTVECMRKTIAAGYPVRVISTVTRPNIQEVPLILSLADRLGVTMVNLHVFSEEGRGIGNASDLSVSPEEWRALRGHLERTRNDYHVSIWYPPAYVTREELRRYVAEGYRGCVGYSLDRLSIFPDGRCYVCSALFDTSLHFGTLSDQGLALNREHNEFELFSQAVLQAEEPWLTGCPAEVVLDRQGMNRTPEHLVSICRFWKSQG